MKIKQHARVAAQSLLATFFVALIVVTVTSAATTIGNNVSTGTVTTTGIVDITGSADTPLTVNGDTASTTLAVYQAGAGDIVNVFDGSTEVFTVLDGGKAGVGSSTPYALLSVEALTGQQAFIVGSSSAELFKISENGTASFNGGGWPDADFTVQGDAQANLLQVDASADRVGIASSTPYAVLSVEALTGQQAFIVGSSSAELFKIDLSGNVTFNGGGWSDADFTVQGDAQANLFQVDASADRVGIASSTPYAVLSVEALTGQQAFIVGSSSAELFKISENGTASFNGGGWPDADFTVQGDAQANLLQVDASADRVGIASSTPNAVLAVEALSGQNAFIVGSSTQEEFLIINDSGSVTFNNGGSPNADFTVEGDTNSALFFIDASTDRVGIGSSTPQALFSVGDPQGNATTTIDIGLPCFRVKSYVAGVIVDYYLWPAIDETLGGFGGWATSTTSCF